MKNQKRMVAVIAASGLALGSMPGIASAQSVEIGLGVGAEVGSVAVGVALGSTGDVDSSGGTGSGQLAGSLEDLFDGGSSNGGSSNGGSSNGGSSNGGSSNGGSSNGGSSGLTGSLEDLFDGGSSNGGSSNGGSSNGGSSNGGSLGAVIAALGSSAGGSSGLTGSLEDLFDGGSSNGGSSNLGSSGNTIGGSVTDIVGSSSGSEAAVGAALAIGSLAAVGVGVHSVANAGVQLPPLPAINVGAVCNLPQEAIDFLKDNGSMERQECEPEEQPAP